MDVRCLRRVDGANYLQLDPFGQEVEQPTAVPEQDRHVRDEQLIQDARHQRMLRGVRAVDEHIAITSRFQSAKASG